MTEEKKVQELLGGYNRHERGEQEVFFWMKFLMKRSVLGAIAFLCMTLPNAALCDFRDSRVAYYPFSSDANDRSGNGNHLSVDGAQLTTDRFDQPNSAFELDGIDDYLEKRYPSSVFNAGAQSWTVSAWIRTDDDSGSFVERYGCGSVVT